MPFPFGQTRYTTKTIIDASDFALLEKAAESFPYVHLKILAKGGEEYLKDKGYCFKLRNDAVYVEISYPFDFELAPLWDIFYELKQQR